MSVKPEVKSFLIADYVMQERHSNKWSAVGIFDKIYSNNYPCAHPNVGIYIRLADAEGEYKLKIEFCDSEGKKLAIYDKIMITVQSRLATPDFGIQTHRLPLPKPDVYHFNLYFNDEFVVSMPLTVELVPKGVK